jgi:hypothetical protein
MPKGDGTGPAGKGGGGKMGGPLAAGPGGYCMCQVCGHREPPRCLGEAFDR